MVNKDVVSKMDSLSFSRSLVLLLALIITCNEAQKDMTEVNVDPNEICDDGKVFWETLLYLLTHHVLLCNQVSNTQVLYHVEKWDSVDIYLRKNYLVP